MVLFTGWAGAKYCCRKGGQRYNIYSKDKKWWRLNLSEKMGLKKISKG